MKINWRAYSLALVFAAAAGAAAAQTYPAKPVRLVVPFAPGGTLDITTRILADQLRASGYTPLVDNRAGADGVIGSEFVARSAPDGYTVLMSAITIQVIQLALYEKLPYDLMNDFVPVSLFVQIPLLLVTHKSLPVKTVKELIALAKSRPGELLYSSSGTGSSIHLAGVLFDRTTGTKTVHVAYKGGGPATIGLVVGEVHYSFMPLALVRQHAESGRLRAIAVASLKRDPNLPNIPTVSESGLKGFEADSWYGVMLPAKTPREIVAKLNADVVKAIASPVVTKKLTEQSIVPRSSTPEEFADYIRRDARNYSKLVKESGIKLER